MRQPWTQNICSPWANKDFVVNKWIITHEIWKEK